MIHLHRIERPIVLLALTAVVLGVSPARSNAAGGGHGGGAGHIATNRGFAGHPYYGPGYRGYGYYGGYYGYGFPLGIGLGIGLGYGAGYGYPYYGYPGYSYAAGPVSYPVTGYAGYGTPEAGYGQLQDGSGQPMPAQPNSAPANLPPLTRSQDTEVSLVVRVPANAQIWVNGMKTNQSGPRREFLSTGLEAGRNYTFHIRAQWIDMNGSAIDTDRRLSVQAGERRAIDFVSMPQLPGTGTNPPPEIKP